VALEEVEVEKSVEMRMVALEQLSWFRPDPAPEAVLSQASGSTTGAGADARA
jgi:hypothetical protein